MIEKPCADQRHLFLSIDGEFYFIPAESIGCPLEFKGEQGTPEQFNERLQRFRDLATKDKSIANVQMAVWLKSSELLWGVMGGKG